METAKKVGIIVRSDDPETCRAAMLRARYYLLEHKDVKVFLDKLRPIPEDAGLTELLENVKRLGGAVLICHEKEELAQNLREYFHPYLTQNDIAEIVNSRIFHHFHTQEIDVREFS